MQMRFVVGAMAASVLAGVGIGVGIAAQAQNAPAPAAVAPAPKDKAGFYSFKESQAIWKDLEKRQVINQRVAEGGAFSINVRIVKEGDAPLIHGGSADVWVVQEGTATAVTGGKIPDAQKRGATDDYAGKEIVGGVEQKVSRGDIVFVPKGVPHTFKDMKGFHAYLIRFDTP